MAGQSRKELTIAMVGSGGDGVVTMGDLMAQAAAREGLHLIKTEAYGPQIRGGESSCTVRWSTIPIHAQGDTIDVMVAFGWGDLERFRGELVPSSNAIVLCEEADPVSLDEMKNAMPEGTRWISVPFARLAKEALGSGPGKNVVTLGLVSELFGLPVATLRRAIDHRFARKGEDVRESNLRAFDSGVAAAQSIESAGSIGPADRLVWSPGKPKILLSGNEATAIGALHAGCRFFAGYPITPSSEILHFLAEWLPRYGGTAVQTEDELAAIGAVIGASFAGVKSMTATSGPGLSLMTEMLGLASMTEVPTVIVNVQRGGPSTGLPTKSEQSDLWQALYGTHGDAPRVVLACSDVEDSFHTTVEAFNISEEFQIPVIVLSDQSISGRRETLSADGFDHEVIDRFLPPEDELEMYERYKDTVSGVSPMSIPGMKGGTYQTNGLEHDEAGRPSSMFLTHEKMNAKRYRKLWPIRDRYRHVHRIGPEDAEIGILCWGSSKGPVEEAVERAIGRGEKVAAFVPRVLYPFPKKELETFLAHIRKFLVIDLSYSAQFYKYLRTFLTLPEEGTHVFKRSGGKNLTVVEIEEEIAKIMKHHRLETSEVLA